MKVAVIGTGIAGNTAVWRLDREHDVTVFEANHYAGGHTHTHSVDTARGPMPVDSGFIVFNERTYPEFIAMLAELGVEKQPTEMSFSVHCERTGLEYAGTNLNALFAQRRNLLDRRFHRLLADILRFNREAADHLADDDGRLTLGDYLDHYDYGLWFRDYYVLPMGAAIWSQEVSAMLDFPARFFVRFFDNHGLLQLRDRPQWYTVRGGSKTYVERIYDRFRGRLLLGSPAQRVYRHPDWVEVVSRHGRETFDAVFFACHADQALALLDSPTREERAVLGAFPYQENEAVLHRGDDLLPGRRARSSWNYRLPPRAGEGASVTYDMVRLQSLPVDESICVTLNPGRAIPDEQVIAAMTYEHPVFTLAGLRAQSRQAEINGPRRSFFCGAYWRHGFHEDGVVSALRALEHFEQWKTDHEELPLYRAG